MHTIDAQNKTIGRVSSEAAKLLMGKDSASFVRNQAPNVKVHIVNASQAKIHPKKLDQKIYKRFSGYPSGLKERTMELVIEKKGYGELFRKAIQGMLPANKLRSTMMKNLIVTE